MNAARRSLKRRDFPPNLYEPRPAYFVWRDPRNRQTFALGYIPYAAAKHQALQANAHILAQKPTLLDKLTGATNTVAKLLDEMPVAENANTAKSNRSIDKLIRERIGGVACFTLTVANCAGVVEPLVEAGKARWAQAVRSRMIAMCRRGQQLGWMDVGANPAEVTNNPEVEVKRERLTLEQFRAIHAKASEVSEWLAPAMMLALVSAQDPSTIVSLKRAQSHAVGGVQALVIHRAKTAKYTQPWAIPHALRLDCIGVTLGEALAWRSGVLSPFVIHHVRPWGNAPSGSAVSVGRFSQSFTAARRLAGISDVLPNGKDAPTLYECRSLGIRLYDAQGNVDTKALAGHTQDKTHALYKDPRGSEVAMVRVG